MSNTDTQKETDHEVARNFGRSPEYYHRHAEIQKETAERLIASLRPWKETLPKGPVLEIGCGTGFVTEGLVELMPGRGVEATDLSPEMVAACRERLGDHKNLSFSTLDAEAFEPGEPEYAMTVSGFVAQWFRRPAITLGRFLEATRPGGLLLASFPGSDSFPEWREACREMGLPFTGNALPDTEEMVVKLSSGPVQVDYYEDTVVQSFDDALDFFRHIKRLGAGAQQEGRHLAPSELKLLANHWNRKTGGDVKVSYHLVFLAVKRNFDS